MGFEIIGTGHFVPGEPVTNEALARVMDTSDEWIYQRSGIKQRHFVQEGQGCSDLAFEASKRALEAARISPKEIDYIIFATMTPEYTFPGSGGLLGAKLGLYDTPALDIRQQCGAMLFGIQLVDALIKAGTAKTILFVGADAHAGFMPWEDWAIVEGKELREPSPRAKERANEHRAVSVLFGDGAGALVFRATDRDAGLVKANVHTDGRYAETIYIGGGYKRRPNWNESSWENMDHVPRMDGRELFKFAVTRLPQTARKLCEETKTPIDKIDWFLAHQANLRINNYIREQLGVPEHKMPMNIDRFGNTSAGTLPILIDECTREGKLKKGELNMLLALGAGLNWGCALVRW